MPLALSDSTTLCPIDRVFEAEAESLQVKLPHKLKVKPERAVNPKRLEAL